MHCDLGKTKVTEIMIIDPKNVNDIYVSPIFKLKNNFITVNYYEI